MLQLFINVYYVPRYAQIISVKLYYLHYPFVRMSVYNKHILINVHSMNTKNNKYAPNVELCCVLPLMQVEFTVKILLVLLFECRFCHGNPEFN
jgi:hypothetical protein